MQQLFLRVRDKLGEQFAQTVADAAGEASGSGVRRRRRVARMALVEPQDQRTFHEQGNYIIYAYLKGENNALRRNRLQEFVIFVTHVRLVK